MIQVDPASLIFSLEREGVTRALIARESGLDRSTITRLASGDIRRPSYECVIKLQAGVARIADMQQKRR